MLRLPAASMKAPAATLTCSVPVALASGVTTRDQWVESVMTVLAAAVPPVTVTSLAGNALTGWLKVKVKVVGPVAVVALVPPMATVGATVSKAWLAEAAAALAVPAASVNPPAATVIISVPVLLAGGVTTRV